MTHGGGMVEILCLDMEGVLTPEIWEAVAEHTQIHELLKTTRDIPVYDDLMRLRLKVIAEHDLSMSFIEEAYTPFGKGLYHHHQ